jgi:hypothetical protein
MKEVKDDVGAGHEIHVHVPVESRIQVPLLVMHGHNALASRAAKILAHANGLVHGKVGLWYVPSAAKSW